MAEQPKLINFAELLKEWDAFAEAAYEAKQTGKPLGPQTGLGALDRELCGALQPGLHMLTGDTGTGKTALALQIAATNGFPALYVSCEMGPLELLRRMAARVTSTYLGRFKTGELEPAHSHELARRAIESAPMLAILDATRAYVPVRLTENNKKLYNIGIMEAAEAIRGDSPHVLIVIDSLHSWVDSADTSADEYDRINAGLSGLKQVAAALECPILAISEQNRANKGKGGTSSGAGSRKIEYGAETQIDLHRDMDIKPDANGEVPVKLSMSKNRNGAAGRPIDLKFHGAFQRFKEA